MKGCLFIACILFTTFSLKAFQAPSNDNKVNAHLITFDSNGEYRSVNAEFTTIDATGDGVRPSNWSTDPNANVWFKFIAPSSGAVEIEVKTYGSEGYGQYHRLALFDDQGTEVSSTNHVHG
ncbi:hypothetical protein, partial [Roseivirga sp. E12]|uniref:hypothetical protein n=1 Tax=Roseivirga sp. E12 TaxID=2819237 RepID=UPI001ABCC82E